MAQTEAMPNTFETEAKVKGYKWECPEFKVSGVFSSSMVLQRDEEIKIWGFSKKVGGKVTGEFHGETVTATVPDDNKWVLCFKPQKYSSVPQSMKIYDDNGHTVTFDDILIGDVWMVGGQSNGELPVCACVPYSSKLEFNENDNFRLFAQFQRDVEHQQEFCEAPQRDVIRSDRFWKRPNEDASNEFSAIGWFFAKNLVQKTDIPIGVIMICPAGACISELMPVWLANDCGYFKKTNVIVGGYYNAVISPFIGLKFKGMMFFQGESESIFDDRCLRYKNELMRFVEDERKQFGFDFPFYNVQLSSYTTEGVKCFKHVDYIRLQQYEAHKAMNNSVLVTAMDLGADEGYQDWPHSPYKEEVGKRLSDAALAKEYGVGKTNYATAPEPSSVRPSDGGRSLVVKFDNVGDGLTVTGAEGNCIGREVTGFGFGLWDKQIKAKAVITGKDEVTVTVPDGADKAILTYAYESLVDGDNANLKNSRGIPACSFIERI